MQRSRLAAPIGAMLSCLGTTYLPLPALAADQPQTSLDGETSDREAGPAAIIVTARRRAELLKDVPVSVTAFTSAELQKQKIENQLDLQRVAPGLVVRPFSSRNNFAFALRGQSTDTASGSANAVLPYVNEIQISALGPGSYYDLSSIQVLKGPQGTAFGRNTTGGAVLVTTERPSFNAVSGYVSIDLGNYNTANAEAALNLPINETLAVRFAGRRERQDGYVENISDGSRLSATHRDSFRGSLLWRPNDRVSSLFIGEYSDAHNKGDAVFNVAVYPSGSTGPAPYNFPLNSLPAPFYSSTLDTITGQPGAYAALLASLPATAPACGITCWPAIQKQLGPWKVALNPATSSSLSPLSNRYTNANTWYVMNTTSIELSDNATIKNIVGFAKNRSGYRTDLDSSPFPFVEDIYVNRNRQISEELQISGSAFDGRLTYVGGYYFYKDHRYTDAKDVVIDTGPVANPILGLPALSNVVGTQSTRNHSFYLNGEYKLGGGLTVSAGLRYTWERVTAHPVAGFPTFPADLQEARKDQNPSWQIGLQYAATDELMLYVTHRGSWRSGGFNSFAVPIPKLGDQGGNMFLPEKTRDIEVGFKYQGDALGMPVSADFAGFYQWVDDVQRAVLLQLPSGFGTITYNVPSGAKYNGIEGRVSVRPAPWLELGGSGAYNSAKYGSSDPVTLFGSILVFDSFADLTKFSGTAYGEVTLPSPGEDENLVFRAEVYGQTKQSFANSLTVNPGAVIPGYSLLNLRATWEHVRGSNASLSAFMTNATNRRYAVGGAPQGAQIGILSQVPGTPRFYGVNMKYAF